VDSSKAASDLLDLVGLVIRGGADNRELSMTASAALRSLERHGSQRITALAAAEGVSQPSMTQLVQRLEQRGLVTRGSDPTDGRVALVSITDQGMAALAARRARIASWLEAMLADLPSDDAQALADAVAAVLPAIRAHVSAAIGGWSGSSD
jgi:DNA-binding MarR family transcriptional regulator